MATRVDLMSLDAEGYEPQIWQSFDKATVQVDVLVVELNSPDMWPEIIDAGLVCVMCFFDCVFVHRLSRHAKSAQAISAEASRALALSVEASRARGVRFTHLVF